MPSTGDAKIITQLKQGVNQVPDFPVKGVLFEDLTPVIADAALFELLIDALESQIKDKKSITKIAGIEARGFIFGAALAQRLGVGFLPIRKAGKLPPPVEQVSYSLEYGEATLELPCEILSTEDNILLIDDVLATGGTAQAAKQLLENQGARVSQLAVVIDIGFFAGKGTRLELEPIEPNGLLVTSLWVS